MISARDKTLYEYLQEDLEDFCDHYCKYPDMPEYDISNITDPEDAALEDAMQQKLYEEHCNGCPINRII